MNSPAITVLMTVYNGGEYLRPAIESVLRQSFKDFELLVIDDCSSDGSAAIVQSFSDKRIVLHRNSANKGQTKSLNAGLRMARGEFIARMDADDFAYEGWLQEQLASLRSRGKECAACSCRAVVVDAAGKAHKILNTPRNFEEIAVTSLWASPLNHVGVLMRRQAVLDQGGYDESFRIAADYDLWSKLLRNGFALAVTPKALIAIRSHARSVTAQALGKDDIAEVSRIMAENIGHWTGMQLAEGARQSLWRLIYDVESMDAGQMASAYDVFCQVRSAFLDRNHFPRAHKIFAKRARTIFMKKIFDCIDRRDIPELREAARLYTDRHGCANVFFLIRVFSHVPYVLLCLPAVYLKYRKWATCRRAG